MKSDNFSKITKLSNWTLSQRNKLCYMSLPNLRKKNLTGKPDTPRRNLAGNAAVKGPAQYLGVALHAIHPYKANIKEMINERR